MCQLSKVLYGCDNKTLTINLFYFYFETDSEMESLFPEIGM